MNWELIIGLIAAGAILMGMEVYVPGFILGSIGFVLQVVAAVVFFQSLEWHHALMMVTGTALLDGLVVYAAVQFFPKTSLGKRMVLQHTQEIYKNSDAGSLQAFIGKEGVAESMLRPTGTAFVDGKRMDVATEGDFLERGSKIKVLAVKEGRLTVKKIS